MSRKIGKILIANRGEIACRVMETCEKLGISTVAVFSDADANALHAKMADEAVHIGPAPAAESYLIADKILDAAKRTGADAIHPGYGFLSENPEFAEACKDAGIIFIGPSADAMRAMALKGTAKHLMEEAGVPVVPGYHGDDQSVDVLQAEADKIGYPVLIKAVAGGGGKGMRRVDSANELPAAVEAAAREGENSFGNPKLLIEKLITKPRHIEIQVFGGADKKAVHLFERDCSLQRRHQKVLEEAPAPDMSEAMRAEMGAAAVRAAEAIGYTGAGTVEFIADVSDGLKQDAFYFMEMNTRLQVEHPVTEMITGQDLVAWQIHVAEGHPIPFTQDDIPLNGHAIEARLYAEDPDNGFMPSTGEIRLFDPFKDLPSTCRIDTGVTAGDSVSVFYDPMIAKLITWGEDRDAAINAMKRLIGDTPVTGLATNRDFLARAVTHPAFIAGDVHTGFIEEHEADLMPKASVSEKDYAIAAGAIIASRSQIESHDPWHSLDNFRLNLPNTEDIRFVNNEGDIVHILATDGQVTIGDETFDIACTLGQGGLLKTTVNGISAYMHVDIRDDVVILISDSSTQTIKRYAPEIASEDDADGPGAIVAPMPGKVLELKVKNGDTVERGDAVIVVEAMKMEQTLKAPRAGIVANLNVNPGDLVGDSQLLCEITEQSE